MASHSAPSNSLVPAKFHIFCIYLSSFIRPLFGSDSRLSRILQCQIVWWRANLMDTQGDALRYSYQLAQCSTTNGGCEMRRTFEYLNFGDLSKDSNIKFRSQVVNWKQRSSKRKFSEFLNPGHSKEKNFSQFCTQKGLTFFVDALWLNVNLSYGLSSEEKRFQRV